MLDRRFADRTCLISGGSRGIGLAIAVALARRGTRIVLLAKTAVPDPRLPGTIHTTVEHIENNGGQAIGVIGDVRNEDDIARAVQAAVDRFGGIDICINNASALDISSTQDIPLRRFDLLQQVNVRGTFAMTQACLPHLKNSSTAHILTLSPPLNLTPHWLGAHPAYTLSKYSMTLLALGFAAEFAPHGIASNCLWPQTTIKTAAVNNILGGQDTIAHSRDPEIMADAACHILSTPPSDLSGQCLIDADLLTSTGTTTLDHYGGTHPLHPDLFIDTPAP